MTAALLLGICVGAGAVAILAGVFPARVPLGEALARLDTAPTRPADSGESRWIRLIGEPLSSTSLGDALTHPIEADLRILGRTRAEHLARTAALVAVGVLWAPATFALMALGGVHVSLIVPLWASILLGVLAAFIPTVAVRAEAAERRRSFRHALGCFLDLVAVRLAGGAGVESALSSSASAGDGWAFAELRQALTAARLRGEPSWIGLAELGEQIGIPELEELAASAGLAGDEGARVRVSIAAKARAIRLKGLADAEGAAQAASERMSLPVVLLMTGFIVFLGYPAVSQVLNGL